MLLNSSSLPPSFIAVGTGTSLSLSVLLPIAMSCSTEVSISVPDCHSPSSPKTGGQASSSCLLKRKRPPVIEIPNILREIGADNIAPSSNGLSFSGNGVGVSSVKGKKKFMEDAHKIVPFSKGHLNEAFFGVYDGHGGSKAAEFVAQNLHCNILEMMDHSWGSTEKEEGIKSGYLKTDLDFLNLGVGSGACCVTALIRGQEVIISNLGDCRAVLSRGGVAEAVTKDHRAEREDERQRIESKGGYVEFHRGAWRVHGVLSVSRSIGDAHLKDWVVAEPDTKILSFTPDMDFLVLASDGLWEKVGNQEAIHIVSRVCMSEGPHKCPPVDPNHCYVNVSPSSKLRRVSLVKKQAMNRSSLHKKTTTCYRDGEEDDDFSCEGQSPASKSRRISLAKRVNVKTESPSKENRSPSNGLVAACKELVGLALSRGSLDDITVMIIDLNHFMRSKT